MDVTTVMMLCFVPIVTGCSLKEGFFHDSNLAIRFEILFLEKNIQNYSDYEFN
jgi:hypothetical protein